MNSLQTYLRTIGDQPFGLSELKTILQTLHNILRVFKANWFPSK